MNNLDTKSAVNSCYCYAKIFLVRMYRYTIIISSDIILRGVRSVGTRRHRRCDLAQVKICNLLQVLDIVPHRLTTHSTCNQREIYIKRRHVYTQQTDTNTCTYAPLPTSQAQHLQNSSFLVHNSPILMQSSSRTSRLRRPHRFDFRQVVARHDCFPCILPSTSGRFSALHVKSDRRWIQNSSCLKQNPPFLMHTSSLSRQYSSFVLQYSSFLIQNSPAFPF